MDFKQLNEAVNKNLYNLPVVEVATDFQVELIRMLINYMAKKGYSIHSEHRKNIIKRYKESEEENRNRWFDSSNKDKFSFSLKDQYEENIASSGSDPGQYNVELYFIGTNAFIRIKSDVYPKSIKVNVSNMNVQQFFDKFINIFERVRKFDKIRFSGSEEYYKKRKEDPELFPGHQNSISTFLNKVVNKLGLNLNVDIEEREYKKDRNVLRINLDYSKYGLSKYRDEYELYGFKYQFQINEIMKIINYILKYLKSRNYFVAWIYSNNSNIRIEYEYKENLDKDEKNISNRTWDSFIKNLNQFEIEDVSLQQILRNIIIKTLKPIRRKK